MLAVAGLTFAYTSCTDYSEDIDANKGRIDNLGNKLATVEQQIASLKTDVTSLQTAKAEAEKAISALQTSLKSLQGKHDADMKKLAEDYKKADDALKEEIQKKIDKLAEDHKKEVDAVNALITALQAKVGALETEVGNINETIKTLATKEYVDATFATKEALTAAEEKIGGLRADLTAAEGKIKALEDKDVEILAKIKAAKKAADVADSLARKSLGDVAALKTALGVYADKGELEAKIALLDKVDSTLKVELNTKFNTADFQGTFDEALKEAVKAEGIVGKEIAKKISSAKAELSLMIANLKTEVNTKFDRLFAISNELRSLVFIPDLYVDGVEGTEYTYATYLPKKTSLKEETVYDKSFPVPVKCELLKNQWWAYADEAEPKRAYINPTYAIRYQMNPSNAVVDAEDISFVSDDKEFIKTRASKSAPKASLVGAADGVLKVGLTASGKDIAGGATGNMISVLALQAKVRKGDKDTTITSDYAALYRSKLDFLAIAFADKNIYKGKACTAPGTNPDHLWATAKDALENTPSCRVAYDGKLDLSKIVRTIIRTDSKTTARKADDHTVYEDFIKKDGVKTDFNIKYEFELVDYVAGTNTTSESQHAYLNGGEFIPCGTTDGVRNNTTDITSVGRRPLVRVTVVDTNDKNKVILVGFIKLEIVKTTGYKKTDKFTDWTVDFGCADQVNTTLWSQMVDNVIKISDLTKEEFCKMYELHKNASGEAVQYGFDGTNFAPATSVFGTVREITDAVPGTTTDVLRWSLGTKPMSAIYQGSADHTKTIWVRYIYKGTTPTSIYEGIYVRLDVKVLKPAATVGVKLDEYWFNNKANAKINVRAPHSVKPWNPIYATYAWTTDTKQVWEGNQPKFTAKSGESYAKYDPANYDVKYYFAPVQPKVGDYQLYAAASVVPMATAANANQIKDKYDATKDYTVKITDAISVITTKEAEIAANSNAGIYRNRYLLCQVGSTVSKIAEIDQVTGHVEYQHNPISESLLNLTKSDPANQYQDSKLYANIGMAYYAKACNLVMPVDGEINPYYFLRPINIDSVQGKSYIDGVDYHKEESNLDVLDLLAFSDWRGQKFLKAADDFSNIWYFAYYNINRVKVDIDNVTTNMNEADPSNFVNLATKTKDIMLSHCIGKHTDVAATGLLVMSGWYESGSGYSYYPSNSPSASVYVPTHFAECEPLVWGKTEYETLVHNFGFIRYHNNKSVLSKAFKLRIPIAVTYDWGTITTTVEVEVKPLS